MKTILSSLIIFITLGTSICLGQREINVISLAYGAKMVQVPPSKVSITERKVLDKYSAGALFDEGSNVWSSKDIRFPFEFIVELAEEYNIQKLEFDNKCEFYPGIETKKVRVEISVTDKSSGFESVGEFDLETEKLNEFQISPKPARWIKLVILSNHGNTSNVQLAEFRALGTPANRLDQTVKVEGVWHTNWQDMTFIQTGNTFKGSYVYTAGGRKFKGKVLDGKINRNLIDFTWDEGNIEGTAKLYLNQEGNQISGLWKNAENSRDFNLWTMSRTVEESKPIEYSGKEEIPIVEIPEKPVPEVPEKPEVKIAIEPVPIKKPVLIGKSEISVGKTIVLENVFFELGKSSVTASSSEELDKLFEYLQENSKARVVINGHTDKIGDSDKNLILSQERADSIMEYLIGKGIEKKRISTEGKGDTETICLPPCKENRRVDFVLFEI